MESLAVDAIHTDDNSQIMINLDYSSAQLLEQMNHKCPFCYRLMPRVWLNLTEAALGTYTRIHTVQCTVFILTKSLPHNEQ